MTKNYTTQKIYIAVFAFFSLCITQTVYGQSQKNLDSVLEEFRSALINPDDATLLRLTSKDLTYGHSNGVIENQDQFIEALTQLENSVPINQVKSIISIYFSGPKGV